MYSIPRGAAAEVTAAIRALQHISLPYGASPEPTGKLNTYVITIVDRTVTYELIEQDRIVRILTVE